MPSDDTVLEGWLSFTCHFCRAKLRIREKYAHLRGRCPDCGIRIEALKRLPYERPAGHLGDEPVGLAPLGAEDWPEPALHDHPEPSYELVSTPLTFTGEEKLDPPGSTDLVRIADAESARPAVEPVPEAAAPQDAEEDSEGTYQLTPAAPTTAPPPIAEIAPFQLSEAERKPIRTPAPPAKPLIQGVFDFPWQPGNRRVWVLQAVGFAALTFIPAMIHMFYEQLGTGAFYLAVAFMGVGALMVLLITGSYASSWFLDILEQTANGSDEITWTDISFRDGMVILLRLTLLFAITLLVPMSLLSCVGVNPLLSLLVLAPVLVPIGILSSLGAGSVWMFISLDLLYRLSDRPAVFFILYLQTLPIWGVCATAYYAAISWLDFSVAMWLTPAVGLLISAGVMIYARLLGRVGMVLTQTEDKKKKRKRKKKRPPESGADAVQPSDGERPEKENRAPGA